MPYSGNRGGGAGRGRGAGVWGVRGGWANAEPIPYLIWNHRPLPTLQELCSLFPVPCSLFSIPCSLFPVPCSLFPVPYSLFPVPCSLYLTQWKTAIQELKPFELH
ncbi:MAG: hypothetical protein F6J98_00805 [Moorea sp. SIO4G2]|uniref:hypothetical protein n=1 Tax=unclassified Moorena TaxID=2683338 RepID=UPI0013CB75CA|nr:MULTISPECIES: hypothetical protein [unclassified Moorena]NEO22452.1 hypothetical protein [Moorena sp. SIO4A5]NEO59022.1 hypothetical protein [Moorena sp. SIO4G2]NEP23897.1 hypothetical protein [Moorena sp. SIO3I6]NEQ56562.1 hypothetical protein [Moorena sp. SIO4A1]